MLPFAVDTVTLPEPLTALLSVAATTTPWVPVMLVEPPVTATLGVLVPSVAWPMMTPEAPSTNVLPWEACTVSAAVFGAVVHTLAPSAPAAVAASVPCVPLVPPAVSVTAPAVVDTLTAPLLPAPAPSSAWPSSASPRP